jgi:hypothetical protein
MPDLLRVVLGVLLVLALGVVLGGWIVLRRFRASGFDDYGRPLWRDDPERRGQ